jgi:tetratricopeptide (TPR) repeat protein
VKNLGPRVLAAAAVLAIVIEMVGVAGWWSWRRAVETMIEDAARGADRLASDIGLRLPPVARRSRRLPGTALAAAPDLSVARALLALGRDQVRWAPADSFGFANRGRAALIEGEIDDAAASIAEALARDPTSPALHRLAALAAGSRGRRTEVMDHLAIAAGLSSASRVDAVDLTPEEIEAVTLKGLELRLDYYPRERTAGITALARELRSRGRAGEGRDLLEAELPDPRIAIELARWDVEPGSAEGAVAAQRRLAEVVARPGMPASVLAEAWSVIALARDLGGDPAGAVEAADRALVHDPESAAPYRVLAALAERRGDPEGALDLLRRAWAMSPTDVDLLLSVARTAEAAGRSDDARLALERAVTLAPSDPGIRARLVELELRRGAYLQATLTLAAALDRFPEDRRLLALADRLRNEVEGR